MIKRVESTRIYHNIYRGADVWTSLGIMHHLSKIIWHVNHKAMNSDLLFSLSKVIRKETSISCKTFWFLKYSYSENKSLLSDFANMWVWYQCIGQKINSWFCLLYRKCELLDEKRDDRCCFIVFFFCWNLFSLFLDLRHSDIKTSSSAAKACKWSHSCHLNTMWWGRFSLEFPTLRLDYIAPCLLLYSTWDNDPKTF